MPNPGDLASIPVFFCKNFGHKMPVFRTIPNTGDENLVIQNIPNTGDKNLKSKNPECRKIPEKVTMVRKP